MSDLTTPHPSLTEGEAALAGLIGLLGAAAAVAAVEVYGVWGPRPGDTFSELWWHYYRPRRRPARILMATGLGSVLVWLWHHLCWEETRGR